MKDAAVELYDTRDDTRDDARADALKPLDYNDP